MLRQECEEGAGPVRLFLYLLLAASAFRGLVVFSGIRHAMSSLPSDSAVYISLSPPRRLFYRACVFGLVDFASPGAVDSVLRFRDEVHYRAFSSWLSGSLF